jgi:RNA polymerase sigma-70 factor (ECF subfamily)
VTAESVDLDLLRAGDPAALAAVYRQHAASLLATLGGLLGQPADAEDVLHDLFVGLPTALARYDERGRFGAWLRRVAVRLALERLRQRKRRGEVALADAPAGMRRASAETLPERLLVSGALAALPEGLRTVVVLREIEGWPHRDIARFLGLTEGAVMTRHSRAMQRLRLALEADR